MSNDEHIGRHFMEHGSSEFDDAYDAEVYTSHPPETLTAELLEKGVTTLSPAAPVSVGPKTAVGEVVAGMAERNQGCVLVVEGERLIGIFTERDLVRRVYGRVEADTPVGEVMTRDPEAVGMDDSIAYAMNKMTMGGFRHVPVVDLDRRAIGIVSMKDVIEMIGANFPRQVLAVPPDPMVRQPDEVAGTG